ncbi:hypothetical protein PR048_031576 [Dryococelus australis]|uniref:Orange domain-containing protein n=1 Tax=Dryococelus australis TaxID=614101 RepID=A0ABQ9G5N8_9NEOP|nr:hypothetical protein PR048_031576 [Dryococelus australis]
MFQPARHSKLEKADILEMTVKHLQSVQRQQLAVAMTTDPTVMNKFKSGFSECAGEVSRFISRLDGVDASVKQRLIAHLANCIAGLQQLSPFSFSGIGTGLLPTLAGLHSPVQQGPAVLPEDVNNNNNNSMTSRLQMSAGLQLIPSRLPTGELALLVPNSNQLSSGVLPFFASTPASVTTSKSPDSPIVSTPSKNGVLNSTAMSVSIDRSHPSAFTAVTRTHSPSQIFNRSQSPTHSIDTNGDARQTVSPLLSSCSPDYSSSSCEDDDDDDSLISDSYLSPNSPLANKNVACSNSSHYQDNQSHSQHSHNTSFQPVLNSLHFKITPSSLSGFKPYNQTERKKPQQQPTVTSSTCPESSSEPSNHPNDQSPHSTFAEVKLELKTIPMSSNPAFQDLSTIHVDDSFSNLSSTQMSQTVSSSTPTQLPLPVIAYNEKANIMDGLSRKTLVISCNEKDPLDFSFRKSEKCVPLQDDLTWQQTSEPGKKRHLALNFSEQLHQRPPLAPPDFFLPSKIPRLNINVITHKNVSHGSSGDSDQRTATDPRLQCAGDGLISSIVEGHVTASSSCLNGTSESINRDMWRPW